MSLALQTGFSCLSNGLRKKYLDVVIYMLSLVFMSNFCNSENPVVLRERTGELDVSHVKIALLECKTTLNVLQEDIAPRWCDSLALFADASLYVGHCHK